MDNVVGFLEKAVEMVEKAVAAEAGPVKDRYLLSLMGYLVGLRDAYQVVNAGMDELAEAAADDGDDD